MENMNHFVDHRCDTLYNATLVKNFRRIVEPSNDLLRIVISNAVSFRHESYFVL